MPMSSAQASSSASSSSCPTSPSPWYELRPFKALTATNTPQFDVENTVSVEVTISDDSIFNGQTAFRRAELIPASNDGADDSTVGIKSVHFSVMKSNARPLNLSHEYQLAFLETADFSANQFVLKTGTILGQNTADPDTLQLFGNTNDNLLLFSAPFTAGVFHNFALTLDFDALCVFLPTYICP